MLASAINKRSFISRLLESGAAALIPLKKNRSAKNATSPNRTDGRANAYAGLLPRVTELNE
jgi:hypothetical protein